MEDIHGLIRLNSEQFTLGTQIKLFDRISGDLISQTISDVTGRFTFFQVSSGKYMIAAYPPLNNNNAQVKKYNVEVI